MSINTFNQAPAGFLLTWRTYGTWLPGDQRGWTSHGRGAQSENPSIEKYARQHSRSDPVKLDRVQRHCVIEEIQSYCKFRGWMCYAVTCQSNHVHVVLQTRQDPLRVMAKLKTRCTRGLHKQYLRFKGIQIWAARGSVTSLPDLSARLEAVQYVDKHDL
jgi:REP element-mobilizing transposase RayT